MPEIGVLRLHGAVQHYDWGGCDFIPDLLGQATYGPDLIIVVEGATTLTARGQSIPLARGAIVLAPFGTHYVLNATAAPAMLFKASVPGRS